VSREVAPRTHAHVPRKGDACSVVTHLLQYIRVLALPPQPKGPHICECAGVHVPGPSNSVSGGGKLLEHAHEHRAREVVTAGRGLTCSPPNLQYMFFVSSGTAPESR
jgi:hypothetical protein